MLNPRLAARLRDASVTAIASVIGGVLTLVGVYLTGWFAYSAKDEELRYHLVEVALGILNVDPKDESDEQKQIRGWAIELIGLDSGVKFPEKAAQALKDHPLQIERLGVCTVSGPGLDREVSGLSPSQCSAVAQASGGVAHWAPAAARTRP